MIGENGVLWATGRYGPHLRRP